MRFYSKKALYWNFTSKIYVFCVAYTMCFRAVTYVLGLSDYAALSLAGNIIFCIFLLSINSMMRKRYLFSPETTLMLIWLFWIWSTIKFVHVEIAALPITRSPLLLAILCVFLFVSIYIGVGKYICYKTLFGLAMGGGVVAVLSLLTGEIFRFKYTEIKQLGTELVGNANDFGYILVLTIIACSFLALNDHRKFVRKMMVWSIGFLAFLCVLSGSRKAFLAILLFGTLFVFFCYPKLIKKNAKTIIYILLLLGIIGTSLFYVYNNTYLGERFQGWIQTDFSGSWIGAKYRFQGRNRLYLEGLELITEHPIFGVGLNQFRYYDEYKNVSHSEYISLFCETGIPGAILYFGAYIVIIARLRRLRRMGDSEYSLQAGLLLAGMLTILILDLGRWNWDHPPTWVFIAAVGAFGLQGLMDLRQGRRPEYVACSKRMIYDPPQK